MKLFSCFFLNENSGLIGENQHGLVNRCERRVFECILIDSLCAALSQILWQTLRIEL